MLDERKDQAGGVLQRMVVAFETGELVDVEAYVASDYLDHQGLGSPIYGPSGFRDVVRAARRNGSLKVSIEDLIADGKRAAARIHWWLTPHDGGKVVERETIDIIRVENGKAVEHWGAKA